MSTNIDKIRAKAFIICPLETLMSRGLDKIFYKNHIKNLLKEIKIIMEDNDITIEDILEYDKTTKLESSIILKYL